MEERGLEDDINKEEYEEYEAEPVAAEGEGDEGRWVGQKGEEE